MEILVFIVAVAIIIWIFKITREASKDDSDFMPREKQTSSKEDMLFTGMIIGESITSKQSANKNDIDQKYEIEPDLDAIENYDIFEE